MQAIKLREVYGVGLSQWLGQSPVRMVTGYWKTERPPELTYPVRVFHPVKFRPLPNGKGRRQAK